MNLLRQIPKVDDLLELSGIERNPLLTQAAQAVLENLRGAILEGRVEAIPSPQDLAQQIAKQYKTNKIPNLRRVINGTGIILHTNLGRAPLAQEALDAIVETAKGYSNLEYDLTTGKRSNRHVHIEELLTKLTGTEAGMAVNNNAAAILLALSAVAAGHDVIISRGELVEIGGSFRIPEVLLQSGCRLVEVGTTNKTHLADYEKAISPDSVILRVHASNFKIVGFTSSPSMEELSALAKNHNITLIEDLGSGSVLDKKEKFSKADIITFSGDKLLGGPQAGIAIGRRDYIEKMKAHPLARALRIDKLSLAALEATLRLQNDVPVQKMLKATPEELYEKAQALQSHFPGSIIVKETSYVGGGALPGDELETYALAISISGKSAQEVERHFREMDPPIIGRVSKDRFLLDVRTVDIIC